jgi:hypothetical protein
MGVIICYNVLIEIGLDGRKRISMDISRKANREAIEIALQYRSRREKMPEEELAEDNLTQLLAFIGQLAQTPPGATELQRRRKLFGERKRIEGETSGQFYGRLRHWLDRDMPQTKWPLHAPRQTGD